MVDFGQPLTAKAQEPACPYPSPQGEGETIRYIEQSVSEGDMLQPTRYLSRILREAWRSALRVKTSEQKMRIVQRDLGDDTKSFDTALVHALRHDPDVIVLGGECEISPQFPLPCAPPRRPPGDRHVTYYRCRSALSTVSLICSLPVNNIKSDNNWPKQ